MRAIGEVSDRTAAEEFQDILYAQGIHAEIERGDKEGWLIWVKSDDDCPRAAEMLGWYRENPNDPRFKNALEHAETARRRASQDQANYERRTRNVRKSFASLKGHRFGPLTYALIFISAVVFVMTRFGQEFDRVESLWFSNYISHAPPWERVLAAPEWRHGEVWRLLTPVFIHLGLMHIVFNMLWLADLGSMIESRQSTFLLARLVLVLGIASNVVQYSVTGSGAFGGMSGVVYGLIGYMWMRGKYDPACGLRLHPQTVTTAMIWFLICFVPGLVGPIANGAHAGGLIVGAIWGRLAARWRS
ncbi:MAG TPA: rhomboid family intramembrane serine protease [Verrucomicrobiae bacterium]|nr:rhomboid family intramembrane serine protease [Verrucomicrobiae bacterium]